MKDYDDQFISRNNTVQRKSQTSEKIKSPTNENSQESQNNYNDSGVVNSLADTLVNFKSGEVQVAEVYSAHNQPSSEITLILEKPADEPPSEDTSATRTNIMKMNSDFISLYSKVHPKTLYNYKKQRRNLKIGYANKTVNPDIDGLSPKNNGTNKHVK